MAKLILRKQNIIILKTETRALTPLGFECDIALNMMDALRDEAGRYAQLAVELEFESNNVIVPISGTATVFSVRRISQTNGLLITRFKSLEQGAYRLIAEHLNQEKIVPLAQAKAKRRA